MAKFFVRGNTYPVREKLLELGGVFNRKEKAWCFESESVAKSAQAIVDAEPITDYRPHGMGGICVKCGDDCGGGRYSCDYE